MAIYPAMLHTYYQKWSDNQMMFNCPLTQAVGATGERAILFWRYDTINTAGFRDQPIYQYIDGVLSAGTFGGTADQYWLIYYDFDETFIEYWKTFGFRWGVIDPTVEDTSEGVVTPIDDVLEEIGS